MRWLNPINLEITESEEPIVGWVKILEGLVIPTSQYTYMPIIINDEVVGITNIKEKDILTDIEEWLVLTEYRIAILELGLEM